MPLILDDMRREFAQFLADDPATRWRMDAALAHVITLAHQAGLGDAQAMEAKIAAALEALNNPMLEHHEARSAAAAALSDEHPTGAEVKPVLLLHLHNEHGCFDWNADDLDALQSFPSGLYQLYAMAKTYPQRPQQDSDIAATDAKVDEYDAASSQCIQSHDRPADS